MDADPIHTFERPPLVETVLGVQFKRLPKLTTPYLSLFWESLGPEWVNVEEVPALEPQYERFAEEKSWTLANTVNIRVSQVPEVLLRISNSQRTRMIQVQNGRLHYNWLGAGGTQDYPHYSVVRPEFEEILSKFRQFLEKKSLGTMDHDQWEVTYIDHIPKGTVWNGPSDWAKLFPSLPLASSVASDITIDTILMRLSFEIAPQKGRLHIQFQHGAIQNPKDPARKELLRMDLTARGPTDGSTNVLAGLNLGRNSIVRAFFNLTSPEAHTYWGYKDAH